jgi:hypothetical protein
LLKAEGGADFEEKRKDTYEAVRQQAMKQGYNLSTDDLWDLADKSMMFGWGESGQEYELQRAISEKTSQGGVFGGDVQGNVDGLRSLAEANGVKLDDAWMYSKAKSIASGLSLDVDVQREVRQMAASQSPGFATQILAGENLYDLVSPWRAAMADEWDIAPTSIKLSDPMLQQAVGGFDQQGNPQMMDLGQFRQNLRKDPRWLQTDKGQNSTTSAFAEVLKMFGMGN